MKKRLKILYKDDSGKLILQHGAGPCDIYITNNINEYTQNFVVISKNKKFYAEYSIKNIRVCNTITWDDYSDRISHYKTTHKQIYDYITKEKDSNGIIKWYNMLIAINNIPKCDYKDEEAPFMTNMDGFIANIRTTFASRFITLDGINFVIEIYNDFIYFPVIHIRSEGSAKFDSMIRLDTLEYFGGDKLSKKQYEELIKFLTAIDLHYPKFNHAMTFYDEWSRAYKNTFQNIYDKDINMRYI